MLRSPDDTVFESLTLMSEPPSPSQATSPVLSRACALQLAATWLIAFGAVLVFLWPLAMLYDSDSYYHLTIARAYLQRGLFFDLPWARFSAMHAGFGDKELGFHLLLLPAAAMSDPVFGAKLTLAVLIATILTSFGRLAVQAGGAPALVLPALALFGSLSFDLRIIRLRPELLALLLLLWTVHLLCERRALAAGACACAFALGYTAIHALLGVCGLCFALRSWLDRRASWALLLAPVSGALVGLALHPHFPQNLRVFYLQNVVFWRYQNTADIGDEILPLGLWRWLHYDWPLLLGCALMLSTLRRVGALEPAARAVGLLQSAAALPFLLLFVHSARFAVYAIPFGLLAGMWAVRLCGFAPDTRLWLCGRAGPRAWLVWLLLGCVSVPLTAAALEEQVDRGDCVWPALRGDLERLGRALPDGAKVAAPWDRSEDYMYFAPQARYLNVLDPLFMRAAYPQAYRDQGELFAGQRLDVPLTLRAGLDSDFLVFPGRKHLALREQLAGDPRLESMLPQSQMLYRVLPERARAFVRDFRVAEQRAGLLQPSTARYPRHPSAAGREVEGMIDGARLPGAQRAGGCLWFAPEPAAEQASAAEYELASTVPARLWLGERVVASLSASKRLLLGQGTRIQIPSLSTLAIELCPEHSSAPNFYMLRRD
jgi:hypothetical protein